MGLVLLDLGVQSLAGATTGVGFGGALASGDLDGDGLVDVAVGAAGESRVYLFEAGGGEPGFDAGLELDGDASSDQFGAALWLGDFDGDGYADLLAGAPAHETGTVYRYAGSATGVVSDATHAYDGDRPGDAFGTVIDAGDLDGDGEFDLVVGAPSATGSESNSGATYVLYAGDSSSTSTLQGAAAGDEFASALVVLDDIDGDGKADVAVGAPGVNSPGDDMGAVSAFLGAAGGVSAIAAWTASGNDAGDSTGQALATGDFDGDGFADLVVSSVGDAGNAGIRL